MQPLPLIQHVGWEIKICESQKEHYLNRQGPS